MQTLALYDRFGRLTYGSETAIRDCIEYVVLEKYISDEYSKWRVHGKIIPDWVEKSEGLLRTMKAQLYDEPVQEEDENKQEEKQEVAIA